MIAFHLKLRFLGLLLIENASYIDDTDPKWSIYYLVKKMDSDDTKGPIYSTIGYTTVYHFLYFPDKVRAKIR